MTKLKLLLRGLIAATLRGNHEVMMGGTFANIRIRNEMVPGVEGGVTRPILFEDHALQASFR